MDWKRARRETSMVAERRVWETRDHRYRVIESHIPLAYDKYRGLVHLGYNDVYYAMCGNRILSKHRSKERATKACETHEAKQ